MKLYVKKIKGVIVLGLLPSVHQFCFELEEEEYYTQVFHLPKLVSKGLIKEQISSHTLQMNQKSFLEKFVIKYEQEAPELLKIIGSFTTYTVYSIFGFRQLSWTAKSNTMQDKGCTFFADSKTDPTTQHNE
ncbi:hypothetical protein C5167_042671 [Papaver somniferum]|uniref:Uncharacterized protein n=1 Tax=Papaver somniferum TaxID=3469 RepID=A0A4Y7L4I6_PAPSO|nr:hypothetical protein C5167_042671 [Papaver somniferum]